MKVFKTKGGAFLELTESNYTRATSRAYPYYQDISGETRHYALCPACDNPVSIVNLHVDRSTNKATKRVVRTHARHIRSSVTDIGDYSQTKYETCPYANPVSSLDKSKREEGAVSHDLLQLLKVYPDVILHVITGDIGITVGEEVFEKMVQRFKAEDGHLFRYVNKFNFPYAFIYMADNQNLRDYTLSRRSAKSCKIIDLIESNAQWSFVNKYGQIRRKKGVTDFVNISFYFSDFKIKDINGEKQASFEMIINESSNTSGESIIGKIETIFDDAYFFNIINKRRRLTESVRNVYE